MKNNCPDCGKLIQRKNDNYWYEESGLSNVFLRNIPIYKCSCGTAFPSIFRVGYLNDLIALVLLEKHSFLSGKEIRFLRKNIYFSSKKFASALGVGKTTLSKWENDLQPHREQNDRLIRATYIIHKGINRSKAKRIMTNLAEVHLDKIEILYTIIADFDQDDYVVKLQPILATQTQKINIVLLSKRKSQPSYAGSLGVCYGFSTIQTDQVFASDRLLNSGSESNILEIETGDYLNAGQKA
jgi:YgiT-type zinc finger domain-containing protein